LALCDQKVSELTTQKTQLETKVDELEKALAAAKESAATPSTDSPAVCNDTPSESRKENIRAALDSKNTAAFSTYVTNPVQYVLAASEYGGNVSPDEAALSLEYTHSATGPWDFNLPQATLDAYAVGGYAMYFDANTYVGRAASGMVVAFDFDCDGKISEIFVVADDSLL
jgi:type II secretory pathway component PulM